MYVVYILRCGGSSLYIGHTSNVLASVAAHNEGRASWYTAQRRPVHVVYIEAFRSRAEPSYVSVS